MTGPSGGLDELDKKPTAVKTSYGMASKSATSSAIKATGLHRLLMLSFTCLLFCVELCQRSSRFTTRLHDTGYLSFSEISS